MSRATTTHDPLDPAHGRDANAEFAERSGYSDFDYQGAPGRPTCYPIIFELVEGRSVADVRELVPSAYPDDAHFATARLDQTRYDDLRNSAWGGLVSRWALQIPVIALRPPLRMTGLVGAHPVPSTGRDPGSEGVLPPTRTVIGVIDTGCPFADPRYLRWHGDAWRTRILALWDQTEGALPGIAQARQPADFGRGKEILAADIDNWLAKCRAADGSLDEGLCYRRAGYEMMGEGFVHGAAVLDLAAGPLSLQSRYPVDHADGRQTPPSWRQEQAELASQADIVFVQIARDAVADSTSASLPMQLLDGLRYILRRAADAEHVVVNFSDGTSRALHDGHSLLEDAIAELIKEASTPRDSRPGVRLDLVVAAGNARAQARHAVLCPLPATPDACSRAVDVALMRLPVDNEQAAFLNIGVPPASAQPRLLITPPASLRADPFEVRPGQVVTWSFDGLPCLWVVMPLRADGPALGLAVWAPTAACLDGRRSAPAGDWRLQALGETPAVEWQFWISLAQNNVVGPASIRQARFIDADDHYDPTRWMRNVQIDPQFPLSVIRRSGTLSVPATMIGSPNVFTVGANVMRVPALPPSRYFEAAEGRHSAYSSFGPSPQVPWENRVADFSHCQPGIRGAASPSGRVIAVTGTSFAAPQVARELANQGP